MQIRHSHLIIAVLAIALTVAIIGCNSGDSDATVPPNPTSTPRPATATTVPTATMPVATSTPSATPTPTPTPTATPTPPLPDGPYSAFLRDLIDNYDASPGSISLISFDEDSWPSTAYGCPAPGAFYAQVEVDGWNLLVEADGNTYEYHTDLDGDVAINCTVNREQIANSINLVEEANLRTTTEIEMRRRDANGDFVLKWTVSDQTEIDEIVDTLDVLVYPSTAASCTEVFRVIFKTATGDETIGTICGGNARLIRGDQSFWTGMDANAPTEFSDIIGPYFSNDPAPGLPE